MTKITLDGHELNLIYESSYWNNSDWFEVRKEAYSKYPYCLIAVFIEVSLPFSSFHFLYENPVPRLKP